VKACLTRRITAGRPRLANLRRGGVLGRHLQAQPRPSPSRASRCATGGCGGTYDGNGYISGDRTPRPSGDCAGLWSGLPEPKKLANPYRVPPSAEGDIRQRADSWSSQRRQRQPLTVEHRFQCGHQIARARCGSPAGNVGAWQTSTELVAWRPSRWSDGRGISRSRGMAYAVVAGLPAIRGTLGNVRPAGALRGPRSLPRAIQLDPSPAPR
jgi:hypothetical protein